MLQFSLLNGSVGLLTFSPHDATTIIQGHFSRLDAIHSNTSTLLLSLATSLTKTYSNSTRSDISPLIAMLINDTTHAIFPPLPLPKTTTLPPEILEQLVFRDVITSNPELLYQFFEFIGQTMTRYSTTWTQDAVQTFMLFILVALGIPEGGMSFQGSIDFLVFSLPTLLISEFFYRQDQWTQTARDADISIRIRT